MEEKEILNEHEASYANRPQDSGENTGQAGAFSSNNQEIDYKAISEENYDKYVRSVAEFDNYKKRVQKEKEEIYSFAVCDVMQNILPVIDNLERAVSAAVNADESNMIEGVSMILSQFKDILAKIGVCEIEGKGSPFDPNFHEAVMHIEDESYDKNIIAEELIRGYKYKDKVIRHSMVTVAN